MVKISIKVKPNAKAVSVEKTTEKSFIVCVKAQAKDGRANDAVIEAISDHFSIPKSRVAILRGHTGRNKVVEIS